MKLKGVLNFILDLETADSRENFFCELYACTREKVSGCRLREIKNPASLEVRICLKNAHSVNFPFGSEARTLRSQYRGPISIPRDMTWLAKVCIVKAMVFPVVINRCESWTIKKTEH